MAASSTDAGPQGEHSNAVWQRCLAAGTASAVASFLVNPLEVVKTRMQAQALSNTFTKLPLHPATFSAGSASLVFASPAAAASLPFPLRHPSLPSHPIYRSALDGLVKIVRQEGPQVLWRGTNASVLLSGPLIAIYLPLYDSLLPRFEAAGMYAPLLAGSVARAVACFGVAPLELAKTRMQAGKAPLAGVATPPGATMLQQLQAAGHHTGPLGRFTSMWTGVGATIAKDLPFAAIYWSTMEPLRGFLLAQRPLQAAANLTDSLLHSTWAATMLHAPAATPAALPASAAATSTMPTAGREAVTSSPEAAAAFQPNIIPVGGTTKAVEEPAELPADPVAAQRLQQEAQHHSPAELFAVNAMSASIAAGFAAAATTPFDLAKTKAQTSSSKAGIAQVLYAVAQRGGVRALFAGVGPRTVRAASGYAILMSCYETLKSMVPEA